MHHSPHQHLPDIAVMLLALFGLQQCHRTQPPDLSRIGMMACCCLCPQKLLVEDDWLLLAPDIGRQGR
jgi:hypothetical protein